MESCSISFVIKELQIKTIRLCYIPIRIAKIQNTIPSAGEAVQQQNSLIAGENKR